MRVRKCCFMYNSMSRCMNDVLGYNILIPIKYIHIMHIGCT